MFGFLPCAQGSFIRIYGSLQRHGSDALNAIINVYNVKPLRDLNELTFHFLECVFVHKHLASGGTGVPAMQVRSKEGEGPGPAARGAHRPGCPLCLSHSLPSKQQTQMGGAAAAAYHTPVAAAHRPAAAPGNAIGEKISMMLQGSDVQMSAMGLHVNEIRQRLGGNISERDVREALESLTNAGMVYTTDEDMYKSTM